jgi:hypothetical protein
MKKYIFALLVFVSAIANAQTKENKSRLSIGAETDVLPYITGGNYGSAWVSKNHFRYRAVITNVTTPEFMLKDGFTNNNIMVYAALVDYFFKPIPEKWWIGAGFEYWDAEIQTSSKLSTVKYNNTMFTAGGGYVWRVYKNFYLNPWAAAHVRIAGDKSVMVDGKKFEPSLLLPELSLKIGWYFNTNK